MKVDYHFPPGPPDGAAAAAARAAEMGYDGFFSAETRYDPFLPLAFAARESAHLDLGTAIAVAFPRSPMITAMTSWDLARLSGGRFILGLGTQVKGHITRRFSTEWSSPGPRLADYIASLRAIWDAWQNSVPLRHQGDFYQFSLMTPFFDPGPISHPDIPVYIAGVGPYLSELAGRVCDGFHIHPFHTIPYLDQVVLPNVAEGAGSAGRSIDEVEMATTVFLMTGESDEKIEKAMEPVRSQISFYGSTPSYRPVFEATGWDFHERLHAMSRRGQWAEMASAVPDEAVLEAGVAAPLDRLADAIKERYRDRVQRVGFYAIGSSLDLDRDALRQVIKDLQTG